MELHHSYSAGTAFKIIILYYTTLPFPLSRLTLPLALAFTPSPGYKSLSMLVSGSDCLSAMNNVVPGTGYALTFGAV